MYSWATIVGNAIPNAAMNWNKNGMLPFPPVNFNSLILGLSQISTGIQGNPNGIQKFKMSSFIENVFVLINNSQFKKE